MGVISPQDTQAVGEVLLEHGNGLVKTAHRLVGTCKIVPGNEGVAVISPQDTQAVISVLLVQADRLVKAPRTPVGTCKVVTER